MATHENQWDACPDGELQRMVEIRRDQRRRRFIDRAAMVAACMVVAVAVGAYFVGLYTAAPQFNGNFGGIACARVRELLPDYIRGERSAQWPETVDEQTRSQVASHLEQCSHCRELYEALKREAAVSALYRSSVAFALLVEFSAFSD